MATIISLALAAAVLSFGLTDPSHLMYLYIGFSVASFFAAIISYGTIVGYLERSENGLVPRVGEAVKSKFTWKVTTLIIFTYPLFSLFPFLKLDANATFLAAIWLVVTGLTIDVYHVLYNLVLHSVSPYEALQLLKKNAERSIGATDSTRFRKWVDAISDACMNAMDRANPSVSVAAIETLESLTSDYVKEHSPILTAGGKVSEEQLNYAICFVLQRIDQIHQHALQHNSELVVSQVVLSLGKTTYFTSRYAPSLSGLALDLVGKVAVNSLDYGMSDIGIKSMLTLQETGKAILEDDAEMQLPIQDIFFGVIDRLEEIAQSMFKLDRSINIDLLTQPFKEIKLLFTDGKYASHPDAGPVSAAAEGVIGSFDALHMVLRTMPNIPQGEEESTNDM